MVTAASSQAATADASRDWLVRLVPALAIATAIANVIGLGFLIAFFSTGTLRLGTLNDLFVAIQYALMLPLALGLHRAVRLVLGLNLRKERAIGLVGILGVCVLQALLAAGVIPFAIQIGPVVVAFIVATAWLVMIGRRAAGSGLIPGGTSLHVLAGLYVGYWFWAIKLARRYRQPLKPAASRGSG